MKIKDLKHGPIHYHEDLSTLRFNCVLGNGFIDKTTKHIYLYSEGKHKIYFRDKVDKYAFSLEASKKALQKACNDYIQEALGWLEGGVKYKLDEV